MQIKQALENDVQGRDESLKIAIEKIGILTAEVGNKGYLM
jgi:hypothetical protein